jgi:hypothetical protein
LLLRRNLPLTTLIALALPLAACGGGESDEDRIAEVIRISATTEDPANCTRLVTQRFLEQTEFAKGAEAVESCEERDPSATARSVAVANVHVQGDRASADARFEGSAFDGQTLAVSLVRRGEQWKLDRVIGFRGFRQGAFMRAYERALTAPPDALPEDQAACIVRYLGRSEPAGLQTVLLGGDPKPLRAVFRLCA